jgi:hypothetical protein
VRKAGARTSGCARESEGVGRRRESAVGGLDTPARQRDARGRVGGSRPSGASTRLREGGSEGVGRRGPRRACAREGRRESAVGGRGPRLACAREGWRESAVGGLDAPARGRVGGYSARLREGRRESATASASGGAPARLLEGRRTEEPREYGGWRRQRQRRSRGRGLGIGLCGVWLGALGSAAVG